MNYRFLFLIVFGTIQLCSTAQLLPSITSGGEPQDNDAICTTPWYTGNFETSGYHKGDYVPDFTIYDLNSNTFQLKTELAEGQPVLLVAGNITCPIFRDRIRDVNTLANDYDGEVRVIVVYGLEAHPAIDTSIYFGRVNTGNRNRNDNILFRQPTTYGERKALVDTLLNRFEIDTDVFIDGTCNEVWSSFGPAPNNAYLIDTNGQVFAKHAWFNRFPADMACSIDSLLGWPSACGGSTGSTGVFQFKSFNGEDTARGIPGETLYASGTIRNNSNEDVVVQIKRTQVLVPTGWDNSLCIVQCFPPEVDTTDILLIPGQTETFSVDFYTAFDEEGMGKVTIDFINPEVPNNKMTRDFYGITDETLSLDKVSSSHFRVYPNPAKDKLYITGWMNDQRSVKMYNTVGELVLDIPDYQSYISLGSLSQGVYHLQVNQDRFYRVLVE